MKIYILIKVDYDYYTRTKNIDASTDVRDLIKKVPDDGKLLTIDEFKECDDEEDTNHYFIETWEGGVKLT